MTAEYKIREGWYKWSDYEGSYRAWGFRLYKYIGFWAWGTITDRIFPTLDEAEAHLRWHLEDKATDAARVGRERFYDASGKPLAARSDAQ